MKLKFLNVLMASLLMMGSFLGMAQSEQDVKQVLKRVEFVLCPDQKPVGKALAASTPELRVVEVGDFSDAYAVMLRICKAKEIKEEKKAGNLYYTYVLPDGKGQIVLTDKVKPGTKEVAVMDVDVEGLKEKVKQVRFVK